MWGLGNTLHQGGVPQTPEVSQRGLMRMVLLLRRGARVCPPAWLGASAPRLERRLRPHRKQITKSNLKLTDWARLLGSTAFVMDEDLMQEESEQILWGTRARLLYEPAPRVRGCLFAHCFLL